MAEAIQVVNATAPKYLKGASNLTFRKRLWLAMLLRHGRVNYNETSTVCYWDVQFSEPTVRPYGDSGDQTFANHDAYRQLNLDWRGYTATDLFTHKQYLMNRGATQIVDLYKQKTKNLVQSMRHTFCGELYVDGNGTNNENRLHGIESFMADDGNTVAADIVANPSDAYAGQNTDLADQGGSWDSNLGTGNFPNATIATDWPYGTGDVEYDFLAPKLLNVTSPSWATGGTTWTDNCEEVMRQARIFCKTLTGEDSVPYCHMLNPQWYGQYGNYLSAKGRIVLPHREAEDLGFTDSLNFEGSVVKYEYDVPVNTGYGLTPDQMELGSLQGQLFVPDGPEWDIKSKGYLYEVGFWGNLKFQPKFFAKYNNYA